MLQSGTINLNNVIDLSRELLLPNGKLKLLSYKDYEAFDWDSLRYFCHKNARYGLPTIELVDYLKQQINGRSAIEIGAGHGDLGYHLGIPTTDSRAQEIPKYRNWMMAHFQPPIVYPDDIEMYDAQDAIDKYKPQVVVSSWVTHKWIAGKTQHGFEQGIEQEKILPLCETYILVGNDAIHKDAPVMKKAHRKVRRDFVLSRGSKRNLNYIYIWGKYERIS